MKNRYVINAVKNSYFVLALSLVSILIGYGLRIFLSRTLSIDDFGLFYAVSAFMGTFILVRYLGMNQAIVKYIPDFLSRGDKNKVKTLVLFVIIVQGITVIVFTGLVMVFKDAITASLFKSSAASPVLVLMTLSFLPSMFFVIFQSVFQGYQKMRTYALVEPARISVTFAFSILFISRGAEGVALAYLLAAILTTLIFVYHFYKTDVTKAKTELSSSFAKSIFRFSTPVFVSSIAVVIINYTDTLVLTFYRSLEDVALYQVALPTSQLLMVFSSSMTAVALPLISGLYAMKKTEDIGKSIKVMTFVLVLLLMPFIILFLSSSDTIIFVLFGAKFLGAAVALKILAVSMFFYSVFVIFQTTLDAIGKPAVNTRIMFVVATVNLILNLILVPMFGIIGSALASFAAFAIGLALGFLQVEKYIKSSIERKKIALVFLAGMCSAACVYLINMYVILPLYEKLIFSLAAGIAIYLALIIIFKIVTKDDVKFIVALDMKVPRLIRNAARFLFRW